MSVVFIEYRLTDGEITGYGTSSRDSIPEGFAETVETIEDGTSISINPVCEKIDTRTGRRVAKTWEQQRLASMPSDVELRECIAAELSATDQYMVPDRPLPPESRSAWVSYRQALRDLSKINDPVTMVEAWPDRPSGPDPISALRARI
jgi:hypothetical protein